MDFCPSMLTLAKSFRVNFFLSSLESFWSSVLTFGIVNKIPNAPKRHQIPTTKKGSKNPPAWYKADPNAGPSMYPKPKSISVHDMIVETLFGNSFMRIETPAPQAAASATPSRNLPKRP